MEIYDVIAILIGKNRFESLLEATKSQQNHTKMNFANTASRERNGNRAKNVWIEIPVDKTCFLIRVEQLRPFCWFK